MFYARDNILLRKVFGQKGSAKGQFHSPDRICSIPRSNKVFVSDLGNKRIQAFTGDGGFVDQFRGSTGYDTLSPFIDMCSLGDTIFVADAHNHRVLALDENLYCKGSFPIDLPKMIVSIAKEDSLLIKSKGEYNICNLDGRVVRSLNLYDYIYIEDICADSRGRLFLSEGSTNKIKVFDSKRGNLIQTFGSSGKGLSQFCYVKGLCVDDMDNILVSDLYGHRVSMFGPSCSAIKSIDCSVSHKGILVDSPTKISLLGNKLFISYTMYNCISIFET